MPEHPARLRSRDGSIRDVLITANARHDPGSGAFLHTRCFTRDATERNQKERTLRSALELMAEISLDQVITNLVSNAVKYGRGRPIDISVGQSGDRGRLTVIDRGIGIAAEDQSRIFGRFERAVPSAHFGGIGLGLWIVKNVVDAHQGTISLESSPQHGSTFVVELPAGPASAIKS